MKENEMGNACDIYGGLRGGGGGMRGFGLEKGRIENIWVNWG